MWATLREHRMEAGLSSVGLAVFCTGLTLVAQPGEGLWGLVGWLLIIAGVCALLAAALLWQPATERLRLRPGQSSSQAVVQLCELLRQGKGLAALEPVLPWPLPGETAQLERWTRAVSAALVESGLTPTICSRFIDAGSGCPESADRYRCVAQDRLEALEEIVADLEEET
jgi:hypothetical protein